MEDALEQIAQEIGCGDEYRTARDVTEDVLHATDVLVADVNRARMALQNHEDGYNKRAYVRAVFAFVEGGVFGAKHLALVWAELNRAFCESSKTAGHEPAEWMRWVPLTTEEQAQIEDDASPRAGNRKANTRKKYLSMKPNIKFAFRVLAKSLGKEFSLNLGGTGWRAFRDAVDIRNRVTHPKSSAQLVISNDDILAVRDADDWFRKSLNALFKTVFADIRLGGETPARPE